MSASKLSRRNFIKGAASVSISSLIFPHIIASSSLGKSGAVAPSNRITLGFVGLGDQGINMNLVNFLNLPDAQVVAVCDVNRQGPNNGYGRIKTCGREPARRIVEEHYSLGKDAGAYKGCAAYRDFRDLVARDDIDAVVVSTPDHWHVLPSLAAVRAGKDVICEKPLTLTVREGRVLSDAVKQYGRVFQVASENRSKWNFLRACELVRNGRIGKLHTIRTELPNGWAIHGKGDIRSPAPVPEGFDYDMWLGQAPKKPYAPGRCHWNFRWILDYSGGQLTDWGAHINDIAQWGNDTEYTGPISVDGRGVFAPDDLYDTATEWDITFEYANGVTLICKSGRPSIRFEGTEGWVFCYWNTLEASSPEILRSEIGPEEIHLRTCPQREHRDFLNCVKTRQLTYAPAEVGHRSITLSHIGNISMMLGRKLRWDPDAEKFIDDEQANRMLSRPMRSPWHL